MVSTYIKKIMHTMNCAKLVCVQGRSFTCFGSVKCLGHWNFLRDHELCMMVLHIELYLLITLSVTLTLFQGHTSDKQF